MPIGELRLLPWSGLDGKPCYLSTGDEDSRLSRLADKTEALQLDLASELVSHAGEVLGDEAIELKELRQLASDLTQALKDVVRVATSRGHRLPARTSLSANEVDERPRLSAESFG